MTRSVIRLPACPVSDYRPHARAKRIAALATTASLGLLASCTTLGTNISGKFACGAPEGGSCSPATVIDDKALAEITGDSGYHPAGPYQAPARNSGGTQRIAYASTPVPAQAAGVGPQKVLRIVFPSHVDAAGRFHETAVVQAVVDNGQWLAATDGHGSALAATQTLNVTPEILSQLGAPIAALPPVPAEVAQVAAPAAAAGAASAVGAPSAAAVAAARAKAREAAAGKGVPIAATQKPASPELASSTPGNRPATYSPRVED
ncbi:conjugal transfer protein [Sphingomonas koreensis]|uniref:conjugal transfer protein n=1 Tax=Sphingomonas koreensis TaxID=93064 RepID=UPI000F7E3B9D|nr:conjugal transfer protein [Sphingomonas koreensis]RSU74549.1 conjugal transfer protein [Sphingomonas koreensis]RSV52783.1 conjugal transfer protein [Sphingomonas koreensis]RSX22415.1 conjugal transfer protein [Sphingomonas koreensis]RSX91504.1 conjugal transfer protein [Sphingomonas koreensis]